MEDLATENKHKRFWMVVFIVAVLCCLGCLSYFLIQYLGYKDIKNLQSDVTTSSGTVSKEEVIVPVDFEELKRANPHIYAWIKIPNTVIDYPILQHPNELSYYLTHTVNGAKSKYGSIYTQYYNTTDFSDYNTVIYGHNMLNGTMFGQLKKFKNRDFFNENREITVYMPGRILKYKIFAAYVWNDSHLLLNYDFTDATFRQGYYDMVLTIRDVNANIADDVMLTASDKIITLSTCTSKDDERYLVQAVLAYDSDES